MSFRQFLRETFLGAPLPEQQQELARSDLYDTQVGDFWANLAATTGASNPTLIERVWVANRCQQLNSQAIATMPLRHYGGREPAWVSSPDPNWFPNGIGDAVFAIVWAMYAYGDAFLYVTSRYADGYPSGWTVLDASSISVEARNGQRYYRTGNVPLDERNVVQISRDPRGGLRGTSVIASLSAYTNGLLAAADLGRVMMGSGATPTAVLKSSRKLTKEQAEALQLQWMTATSARRGAPAVLPPEIDFEKLAFSPADLLLLDVQQFDAQVIAAGYGVPAQLVNMPLEGGLSYQTPILALVQLWRTELLPAAVRIARALSSTMLPRGQYVEFDSREFLAPTFNELVASYAKLVEVGVASVEQAQVAVLHTTGATAEDLVTPPSAGASPAQSNGSVDLRPTSTNSSYY